MIPLISSESPELGMDEMTEILDLLDEKVGAEFIFGHSTYPTLGDSIRGTLVAAGFSETEVYIG